MVFCHQSDLRDGGPNAGAQNRNLARSRLSHRVPTSDQRLAQRSGPVDRNVRGVELGGAGHPPIEHLSFGARRVAYRLVTGVRREVIVAGGVLFALVDVAAGVLEQCHDLHVNRAGSCTNSSAPVSMRAI